MRTFVRGIRTVARRDPIALIAGATLLTIAAAILFAPLLAPYDPLTPEGIPNSLPSGRSPLGTDGLGRDVLSRLLFGGRTSSIMVVLPLVGTMGIAIGLALVAGTRGGWVDKLIMRAVDVMLSIPQLLLVIALAFAIGRGLTSVMIAVGIVLIPSVTRVVRSAVIVTAASSYIDAAESLGATKTRIIMRHVFPNIVPIVIVYLSLEAARLLLLTASLSFLGIGAQPPTPDWGSMLANGRSSLYLAPHVVLVPGLTIFIVALCLNLLGDALRDALDPRMRNS